MIRIYHDDPHFYNFLCSLDRAAYLENPRVYLKAVRVTLIALGYDEAYINDTFRDYLEEFFNVLYS